MISRIKRILLLISEANRICGGFSGVLLKVFTLLRQHGLRGVWRGFRNLKRTTKSPEDVLPHEFEIDGIHRNDYGEWVNRYDNITQDVHELLVKQTRKLKFRPLISVVMPTYNPKPEWLVAAIESVRAQVYPNWELCIADDCSTDPAIHEILQRYAGQDNRIKVVLRTANGHISAASNSALELATGEWIALLDHDDLITPHALFWVAREINEHPDAGLIYSDEDKINDQGTRHNPYFKCDWNRDLFFSHNLITHLGVYRASLVKQLGGFRLGYEGSQDYDLAIRCIENLSDPQIRHIPRVLYHWRIHEASTAGSGDAKPYALIAAEKALNDHFARTGVAAKVESIGYEYRVKYTLPDPPPLVSLIIPTRNAHKLVQQCIDSVLEKSTYPNYEILLVDNGSDNPKSLAYFRSLEKNPRIRVIRDERPFNFSALNNLAAAQARGQVLCLLNNDIEVIAPDWLTEMVSLALQSSIGAVGAKLRYPNGDLQHGGVILGLGGVAGHSHKHLSEKSGGYFSRANLIQSYSAVTAACLVIRKEIYDALGGLDEKNLRIAFNDVDFCLRIREAGYRNVWTPYAELYHHESATRGYEDNPEKVARFTREASYMKNRWGDALYNDPAYSPNLTLKHEDFTLAWPPRTKPIKKGIWPLSL